jgi:hypothetical protein
LLSIPGAPVFNPKGVASIAHGWRFAYHGKASKMIFNPEGVAACLMGVLSSKAINHEYIFPNATVTIRWAGSSV